MNTHMEILAPFKISLEEAIDYTTHWRDANKGQEKLLKAFTVRMREVKALIQECESLELEKPAIRFYLGKRPNKNNPVINGPLENCLVITLVSGFTAKDDDMVPECPGEDVCAYMKTDSDGNRDLTSGCYDFTYPCPTTCATDSPLFSIENPIRIFELNYH